MSPGLVVNGKSEIDFSYSFAGSCLEPCYSKTYEANVIINGKPTKKRMIRASYTIPIHSGLIGCLMPSKDYKLIPMKGLKDLVIEI